jgi:hypothetical protein
MRRKLTALGVVTSVVAVGLAIVSLVPASSATTITVYQVENKGYEKFVNADGKPSPAGDYLVATHKLYYKGSGKKAGQSVSQLTVIRPVGKNNAIFRAAATFRLADGKLEAAGYSNFAKLQKGGSFTVTGGTGAYENQTGTLVVRTGKFRTFFTFTVD